MKNLYDKIKSFVARNPKKLIAGAALAALIGVTSLKDNVHFGSVELTNPARNHYAWGLYPTTEIKGTKAKGNFYTFGLVCARNKFASGVKHEGNSTSIAGFLGKNDYTNSSHTGSSTSAGIIGVNAYQNSPHTGNSTALAVLVGGNDYKNLPHTGSSTSAGIFGVNDYKNSHTGSSTSAGILGVNDYTNSPHTGSSTSAGIFGVNDYSSNSPHTGNSTALAVLSGVNDYSNNSPHTGNRFTAGIIRLGIDGFGIGPKSVIQKEGE